MTLVGTIRYRLPLEPFLIILAGAGASYLVQQGDALTLANLRNSRHWPL